MEKGKCMLKLWWKIIYLAALGTLILNTYTMVHIDLSLIHILRTKGTEKVHQPTEKTESTAAGAEVKAAGGYAGGDEPGGAAGSCQVEEHP